MYKIRFNSRCADLLLETPEAVIAAVKLYGLLHGRAELQQPKKKGERACFICPGIVDIPPFFMHPEREPGIKETHRHRCLCLAEAFATSYPLQERVTAEEQEKYMHLFGTDVDKAYRSEEEEISEKGYYSTEGEVGYKGNIPLHLLSLREDVYRKMYGNRLPEVLQPYESFYRNAGFLAI